MAFASKDLSLLGGFRNLCSGIDFRRKRPGPPRPFWSTETGYSPETQTRTFLRGLGSLSVKHPIIVITGSSGAGTSTVRTTFEEIFRREGVVPAIVEGDAFHRYDRETMQEKDDRYAASGLRQFQSFRS